MTNLGKGIAGAAAATLLAIVAHAVTGGGYISSLEADGQAALSQSGAGDGFAFAMQRDPLARVALVNGPDNPEARALVQETLLAVPGISAVRWTGGDEIATSQAIAAGEASQGAEGEDGAAQATATSECQGRADAVMAERAINFRSGSAYMSLESLAVTDEVAQVLADCGDVSVRVEGHTDARGGEAINQSMSQERANRVAAALAERGVPEGRISAVGMGSSQPAVEGTSAQANAANRRIAFTIAAADAARAGGE